MQVERNIWPGFLRRTRTVQLPDGHGGRIQITDEGDVEVDEQLVGVARLMLGGMAKRTVDQFIPFIRNQLAPRPAVDEKARMPAVSPRPNSFPSIGHLALRLLFSLHRGCPRTGGHTRASALEDVSLFHHIAGSGPPHEHARKHPAQPAGGIARHLCTSTGQASWPAPRTSPAAQEPIELDKPTHPLGHQRMNPHLRNLPLVLRIDRHERPQGTKQQDLHAAQVADGLTQFEG